MNINELHHLLKEKYSKKRGYGITKVGQPNYKNIWFVVPPPVPTERPANLPLKSLARAHTTLRRQKSLSEASPLDETLAYLMLNREAISSSRMEGTWSTIDHVLSPGDDLLDEQLRRSTESVRSYAKSLNHHYKRFATQGIKGFTVAMISHLHKEVMSPTDPTGSIAGLIRSARTPKAIVQIGGLGRVENSIFNPPPPSLVPQCLKEVLQWYRNQTLVDMGDAGMGLTLPLRMAIGHSHFEAVHPFRDGNGRIGRMLWPLQMISMGLVPLYLSGYVESEKTAYGKSLQAAQKKLSYSPIVEFVCEAICASAIETQITLDSLSQLPQKWRARSKSRRGSAGARTLEDLLNHPIFSVRELSQRLRVSFEAASTAVEQLTKDKIIYERTGFGRNRIFAAEEVTHLLSRQFGESAELAEEKARRILNRKS